jgi:hypothetical protein
MPAIKNPLLREGDWTLCERTGWLDNRSFENILAWTWGKSSEKYLIAVNLSGSQSQALIKVADDTLRGSHWRLSDVLSGETYDRKGDEMFSPGLYVDLQPWRYHFLQFSPST